MTDDGAPESLDDLVREQPDMASKTVLLYELAQYLPESNPAFWLLEKEELLYLIEKYLPEAEY